jgi:hypothetical protein
MVWEKHNETFFVNSSDIWECYSYVSYVYDINKFPVLVALWEAWRHTWGIPKIQICGFLTSASFLSKTGSGLTTPGYWRFLSNADQRGSSYTYQRTELSYKRSSAVLIFSWFSSVIIVNTRFKRSLNGLNLPLKFSTIFHYNSHSICPASYCMDPICSTRYRPTFIHHNHESVRQAIMEPR